MIELLVVLGVIIILITIWWSQRSRCNLEPIPNLQPLDSDEKFDIHNVEPEKFRPFNKPNKLYKWSMSLRQIQPSDLFLLDKEYLNLVRIRRKCLREYPEICKGYDESCVDAVRELYLWVVQYLLQKYPKHFIQMKDAVCNKFTDTILPLDAANRSPDELLALLGETVTEDFLILLPNDKEEYCFKGFVGCAPGGVDSTSRLNKPITSIHEPIPGFLDKLRFAMIKFFNRLPPGQYMMRNNWFIQYTDPPRLFYFIGESPLTENHPMSLNTTFQNDKRKMNATKLDFNQIFLRTEKQSFIKLPQTKLAVMCVKTHVISLKRLRDEEGLGEELSDAIDGIQGNPRDYKGVDWWGQCMRSYLNGETNGINNDTYDYQFEY